MSVVDSVLDFGVLPPEINSGRMYAGAGSGPLVAAAAAWEGLASQLGSAATSYRAVVADLTNGGWVGPSSASMAAAAAPYAAWMTTTATAAEQTASQLTSAIAAYEAAFTATVPPPIIAANRSLLAALVATNIVGQNTPAIAATEAQYAEMWAQDAGAMYGYAGASAAATTVTPFNPPPPTTNPAGTSTQAAAVTHAAATPAGAAQNVLSQVPNTLQSLATPVSTDPVTSAILSFLNSPGSQALETLLGSSVLEIRSVQLDLFVASGVVNWLTPLYAGIPTAPAAAAELAAPAAAALAAPAGGLGDLAAGLTGSYGPGVSAGLGGAATVGGLSVPPSWATASPAIRLAATTLPVAGLDGVPQAGAAGLGGFGGMPMMGGVVNAPRNGAAGPRPESRLKVIPEMARESGVHAGTPDRGMTPAGPAADAVDALSDRERYELHTLRQEIADLAMERDAVDRLIKEAMRR
jgi:PPE-repeat protein